MTTLKEYKAMPVDTQVIINSNDLLECIRVIELADYALNICAKHLHGFPELDNALSEIRKLKGE